MFNRTTESRVLIACAAEEAAHDLEMIANATVQADEYCDVLADDEMTGLDEMILMALYPDIQARVKISVAEDRDIVAIRNA